MQQLSGINVTSYYLPTVLIESVGFSNKMARLLAACNSVSYLLFALIGIPNVERWGRRKMIMYAAAGQCFCYLIITVLLRFNELETYGHREEVASASVAFFFLYYVFFGIGFQGVPWLYPTEINGLAMRAKGAALGTATNWIFNFMVVEITPIGIQTVRKSTGKGVLTIHGCHEVAIWRLRLFRPPSCPRHSLTLLPIAFSYAGSSISSGRSSTDLSCPSRISCTPRPQEGRSKTSIPTSVRSQVFSFSVTRYVPKTTHSHFHNIPITPAQMRTAPQMQSHLEIDSHVKNID